MKSKILIFGATGAVGSSLAKLMSSGSGACHLIGKNEEEISKLSDETGHSYSIADVLDENFIEKIEQDVGEFEISGIAYCIGSIDLKPINLISKDIKINRQISLNFSVKRNKPITISSNEQQVLVGQEEALKKEILEFIKLCKNQKVKVPNLDESFYVLNICKKIEEKIEKNL